MGGGGVDGAIHSAAGYSLRDECYDLGGCDTGQTKMTTGTRLLVTYFLYIQGSYWESLLKAHPQNFGSGN